MANAQRYYPPEPRTLTEAHEHLKQLTDNTYDLRERMDNLQKSHEELKAQQAKPQAAPALPVLLLLHRSLTAPPPPSPPPGSPCVVNHQSLGRRG